MIIEACTCGHLSNDHVRVEYSMFVCSRCACDDHTTDVDPDDVAAILTATCLAT